MLLAWLKVVSEPVGMSFHPGLIPFSELAAKLRAAALPGAIQTRVIGIDGGGGSGKSTLARQLSPHLDFCPVVSTDDFSSWNQPFDWATRVQDQLLSPLLRGQAPSFEVYDWGAKKWGDERHLPVCPFLILEGVGALRSELRPFLSFSIFIDCAADSRLKRGLARDSTFTLEQWQWWRREEDAYFLRDQPARFADLVLNGDASPDGAVEVLVSRASK